MPRAKAGQKRKQDSKLQTEVKTKDDNQKPLTSQEEPVEKVLKFSGRVPIDEGFPQYRDTHHVYEENGFLVFNAMLNQTNIGQNNNKYYTIQVIEHNTKPEYITLCRWGRVGKVAGLSANPGTLIEAKDEFVKKFKAKTGNDFYLVSMATNVSFQKKKGKYDMVHIDYGAKQIEEEKQAEKNARAVNSKLPVQLQELMEMIFDKDEWETSVKEMKFDVRKSPLGKLTKQQIIAGYEALKKIEDCIKLQPMRKGCKDKERLEQACNEFYTKIPHDFGMKKPPVIETTDDIKEKMELLSALNEIQVAVKILDKGKEEDINVLDTYYKFLECSITPLPDSDSDYKIIEKYVKNTHGRYHGYFKLDIEDIFKVYKDTCDKRFKKDIGNRMFLWHGSRLTNWCGILKQGLRIAPPEAPVTGYKFGKGVYFADMVSKSADFCAASSRQPYGLLLVCDVALGNMNELANIDCNASNLPKGKHSTKGLGRQAPDMKEKYQMPSGAVVPLGKPMHTKVTEGWLDHNEYVVYDVAQINPRFLVKVKFDYGQNIVW